jgi:hypothetical protein
LIGGASIGFSPLDLFFFKIGTVRSWSAVPCAINSDAKGLEREIRRLRRIERQRSGVISEAMTAATRPPRIDSPGSSLAGSSRCCEETRRSSCQASGR